MFRDFNKVNENVQTNVQIDRAKLEEAQAAMASFGDNSLLNIEKDLIFKLNVALLHEESLLFQKARVKWMDGSR